MTKIEYMALWIIQKIMFFIFIPQLVPTASLSSWLSDITSSITSLLKWLLSAIGLGSNSFFNALLSLLNRWIEFSCFTLVLATAGDWYYITLGLVLTALDAIAAIFIIDWIVGHVRGSGSGL
jgi:hypothetical protein